MAEGDTIHRNAARLQDALGGAPLAAVQAPHPRSPLRRQSRRLDSLVGRKLERAEARGKHLLLHFEGGLSLHCHQGISGRWRIGRGAEVESAGAWLVLETERWRAAEYGGPRLALVTAAELAADRRLRALGPDILSGRFDVETGVRAVRDRTQPDRQLGDALLDQTVIAGIGNIYKSEGCFAARVDPWRRLGDLTDEELGRVVLETASLMQAGLRTGRQPHDVYRRGERPCPRCGEPIHARGQGDANRITYWCAQCQA